MGSAQSGGPRAHSYSPAPRMESLPSLEWGPGSQPQTDSGGRGYLETEDQEQKPRPGMRPMETKRESAGSR